MLSTSIKFGIIFAIGLLGCGSKKNVGHATETKPKPSGAQVSNDNDPSHISGGTNTARVTMPVGIYMVNHPLEGPVPPEVWSNDNVDGILLRVKWSTIEPSDNAYNWELIDNQFSQALKYNKKVVVAIQAGRYTPEWVYKAGVAKLQFTEINHMGKAKKSYDVSVAPPWDTRYQSFVLDMLTSFRDHIKSKPGFYDALIMIKFTGINNNTDEVRLPSQVGITNGVDVSTDAVAIWKNVGYKPSKVIQAFTKLMDGEIAIFPDKAISVPYIPDPQSFPAIDETGNACEGSEQKVTAQLIDLISRKYADHVLWQWNAFRTPGKMHKFIPYAVEHGVSVGLQLAELQFRQELTGDDKKMDELLRISIENKVYYIEAWQPSLVQCSSALKTANSRLRAAREAKH